MTDTRRAEQARVDRIADPWGPRTPYGPGERWPVRVDGYLAEGIDPGATQPG